MNQFRIKHPIIEGFLVGAVWVAAMVMAMFTMSDVDVIEQVNINHITAWFLGGSLIVSALVYTYDTIIGRKRKSIFITNLISAVGLVGAGIGMAVGSGNPVVTVIMGVLFCHVYIARAIGRIVNDRTKASIIFNVVTGALFLILSIVLILASDVPLITAMLIALTQIALCLVAVCVLAFRRIQLRVLAKIIRKTYAAEIFMGMIMLVLSFSVAFAMLEPDFKGYGDALWYSFAVVTTIGFGELHATNIVTRILSVILGLYGIVVVAVLTSIIVNFYSEVRNEPANEKPEEEIEEQPKDLGE